MSDSVRPHRRQPTRLPHPGFLQARTLEWVAISSSNAWKWKVTVKSLSRVRPLATPWTAAHQAPLSMGFSRQEYWSRVSLPSPKKINTVLYNWQRHSTSLVAQAVKHLPRMQETWVQSLGWKYLLEKEMATHSRILVWKIPWMQKPGRL